MSMPVERVENLRRRLGARAAGLWRLDSGGLMQMAFAATPELSAEVADGFARASVRVELTQTDLGIVGAALTGKPLISIASALSTEAGSGYWLRRLGADRSLALPLLDGGGRVVAVVAVALVDAPPDDQGFLNELHRLTIQLDLVPV